MIQVLMKKRIEKLRHVLEQEKLDALLVEHPIDLFYLTQLELSAGRLLLTPDLALLFVDGRYYESAAQISLPIQVILTSGFGANSAFAQSYSFQNKRVGFDSHTTHYATFLDLQALGGEWVPLKAPVKHLRAIKDSQEILSLRKAAQLASLGFDHICHLLKPGVTEKEIALELELFWRKAGGQRLSFASHIAFGAHSSQPHCHARDTELCKGDIVLMDIGVVCEHYHSDMTRVLFFGEPSSDLERIYSIVHEAQKAALSMCRPGTRIKDLDQRARSLIAEKGYGAQFTHSLGHGIGLEIHEYPFIRSQGEEADASLQEGMVITIEPGIYVPGLGGVRLEDAIIITKEGHENLTQRPLSISLPVLV